MSDVVPNIPQTLEDEWLLWAKQIRDAIHAGYLDEYLKSIAEDCVKRNGRLKDKTAQTHAPKVSPPMPVLMAPQGTIGTDAQATTAKPAKRTSGRRRAFTKVDSTFRFIDGRLYRKSDVVGKTMEYNDFGRVFYIAIRGVGPKAVKVEFVTVGGVKEESPHMVPNKYRDPNSKTGIKDPVFMGLGVIKSIINGLQPVPEG